MSDPQEILKSHLSSIDPNDTSPAAVCTTLYISGMISYHDGRHKDCAGEMERVLTIDAEQFGAEDASMFSEFVCIAKGMLGELLFLGCGVAQDTQRAVKLWEEVMSAAITAERHLGLLGQAYLDGEGTSKNMDEGLKLLELAASRKDLLASISLGIRYVKGDGVLKDADKGLSLLEQAHSVEVCELKDKETMVASSVLAGMLLAGNEIPRDVPRAVSLLEEAASLGSIDAKFQYGQVLLNLLGEMGKEVTRIDFDFSEYGFGRDFETIARGAALIKEAASKGHEGAAQTLKDMELAATREDHPGDLRRSKDPVLFEAVLESATGDKVAELFVISKGLPRWIGIPLSLPWYISCAWQLCARRSTRLRSAGIATRLDEYEGALANYSHRLRSAGIAARLAENEELSTMVNTKLSSALLRNRSPNRGVVVLEYSRAPAAMLCALKESTNLAQVRNELEVAGLSWNLPSGGKIFVRPADFEAVLNEFGLQGLKLKPWHVVVASDMEDLVRSVLDSALAAVPKKDRGMCKVKRRSEIPIPPGSSTETVHSSNAPWMPQSFFVHGCRQSRSKTSTDEACVVVRRTFVQMLLPSSLLDSLSSHPGTM